MIEGAELDAQGIAETIAALEADARALAEAQRDIERAPWLVLHVEKPQQVARLLERAQRHLAAIAAENATPQAGTEWFLDNYYLIRRIARQVEEDLPDGFVTNRPWGKGNNPKTAVFEYLRQLRETPSTDAQGRPLDFEFDKTIEHKIAISASPDGFLRRR